MNTGKENKYIQKIKRISEKITERNINLRGANGSSDARHFAAIETPGIEFGPIGEGIGSDNEWVSIDSLEKYYQVLNRLINEIK